MNNFIHRFLIYKKAFEKFGANCQIACAIEELSELSVELAKILSGKRNALKNEDMQKLIDELADARIMIEQMIMNFEIYREVAERMDIKLERLLKRIEQ